jgi:hypothetical protein
MTNPNHDTTNTLTYEELKALLNAVPHHPGLFDKLVAAQLAAGIATPFAYIEDVVLLKNGALPKTASRPNDPWDPNDPSCG